MTDRMTMTGTKSVCGDCGDAVVGKPGRFVHEDGTQLCGGRVGAIRRHPEKLRHFYCGEMSGGMDVPREISEALGLTVVVFRKWYRRSDGTGVIALFPLEPGWRDGLVNSFEHDGQHGSADYDGTISRTRAAKPHEYESLLRELESPPFNYWLDIKRRAPKWNSSRRGDKHEV